MISLPALHFGISGVPVSIETDSPDLRSVFADYFRRHLTAGPADSTAQSQITPIEIRLTVVAELPASPVEHGAELVSKAGAVELWQEGDQYHFLTPGAVFSVDPQDGRIAGLISPAGIASPYLLANTWALFPLLLALRAKGRYHLHAAAVLSPEDELWLISGPQRSGKTTLATALGISGWRPIADDSVILEESGPSIEALRKRFHVPGELVDRWSLGGAVGGAAIPGGRFGMDGLAAFSSLDAAGRTYRSVAGILLTEVGARGTSSLRPISPAEGLIGLAGESTFFQLLSGHVRRHWEVLGQLARQAGAWRLSAGSDILDDPRRAGELLSGLHLVDRT